MKMTSLGALAACVACLAVLLCGIAAAVGLSTPVRIAMITAGALLLVSAGVLIGVAIVSQKKSSS